MMNERAQIVLRVQPMSTEDCRTTVTEALSRLEGVKTVNVDLASGIVRVDGAVGDRELVAAVESVGRRALVVTHTRCGSWLKIAWPPSARLVPLAAPAAPA